MRSPKWDDKPIPATLVLFRGRAEILRFPGGNGSVDGASRTARLGAALDRSLHGRGGRHQRVSVRRTRLWNFGLSPRADARGFNQARPVPLQVARDLTIALPIAEKFASQSAIFLLPAAFERAARHSRLEQSPGVPCS